MEKVKVCDGIEAKRVDDRNCSTIYILGDGDRFLIIDAGDGGAGLGFEPEVCLLTHGHADHTFGVKEGWRKVYLRREDWLEETPYYKPSNAQDYEFSELKFGMFLLQIIHTPGHTPGSICIFEAASKILFSGDTKFAGGDCGRTDLLGGDERALEKSLKLIGKIPYKLLCPGHGRIEEK